MTDIKKHIIELFKEHKLITDNECYDYAAHLFYLNLKNEHAKHGTIVLDAIEECIFDLNMKRFQSVYRAVYYCGNSSKKDLDKRISILKHVIQSHPDWIVRKEAVAMLEDLTCYDILEKAYGAEQNKHVKLFIKDCLFNKNAAKNIPIASSNKTITKQKTDNETHKHSNESKKIHDLSQSDSNKNITIVLE